jgi:hypothetical protein
MASSGIEARLDKLLEKVSGGAHVAVPDGREVARVVKRTEIATTGHKRNLVKYIVIGIAIILILVGIVYFVSKTGHGKVFTDKMKAILPFVTKKRKFDDVGLRTQGGDAPRGDAPRGHGLVAQDVDFRTPSSGGGGPPPPAHAPSVRVQVPRIPKDNVPEGHEPEEMDPGAVRFRRKRRATTSGAEAHGPPPSESGEGGDARGPSPPVDDSGPGAPPAVVEGDYGL